MSCVVLLHDLCCTDNSYVRLRHLLIWRADVERTDKSLQSGQSASVTSASSVAVLKASKRCSSGYMLLFYAVLLLSIIAANTDWNRVRREMTRLSRTYFR